VEADPNPIPSFTGNLKILLQYKRVVQTSTKSGDQVYITICIDEPIFPTIRYFFETSKQRFPCRGLKPISR